MMGKIKQRIVMFSLVTALIATISNGLPANQTLAETAKTRTVVDQNGRAVKIPAQVKRVVVTTIWPLPSVFMMVDGSAKKLVGIPPASRSAAQASMLATMTPEILKAETGFVNNTDVNLEELMKLRPDVVLYRAENTPEQIKLEKTGIPAVAFKTASIADANAIENVYTWMKLLGQILGKESKAELFKQYAQNALEQIQERTRNLPLEKKPRVLFLFRHNEKEIIVPGTGHFGQFWLTATGAVNCAAELKGTPVVNMEQIYRWDPDIIYITNFTETLPQDLLENKVNGQDWSRVKAVKNRRVYKVPLGIYRWYPPSTDAPLMLKWLAQKNHPELFKDFSIEKALRDYYKQFYRYQLNEREIQKILNPPREAAKDA